MLLLNVGSPQANMGEAASEAARGETGLLWTESAQVVQDRDFGRLEAPCKNYNIYIAQFCDLYFTSSLLLLEESPTRLGESKVR